MRVSHTFSKKKTVKLNENYF